MASAQSTDTTASSPTQVNKAQRKPARKAVRANENADLKILEQNSYHAGRNQRYYPQSIQDTEKTVVAKAASEQ